MTLTPTAHRGTKSIGGSCIEIEGSGGERLILDAGRPLDACSVGECMLHDLLHVFSTYLDDRTISH